MNTKQQVIDNLRDEKNHLWKLLVVAVTGKNLNWSKNIIKSIENKESDLKRLQQEIK